ncbi:MAG TPA: PKD domain-containing protein [Puia sp.]|nr:PKD domain-containing protein [Puia sp.]
MTRSHHITLLLLLCCLRGAAQQIGSNIEFVENKGQWDSRVKFKGEISVGSLYLEKGGYTTMLYHPDDLARLTSEHHGLGVALAHPRGPAAAGGKAGAKADGKAGSDAGAQKAEAGDGSDSLRAHSYRVRFLGASDQVTIVPDKPLPGYNNYFIGRDRSKWATGCKVYQGVTYHNLYPGIDIRYYTNAGQLKYDLIVHPGADVRQIRMRYEGVDKLTRKKEQLIAATSVGDVTQLEPYSYTFDARKGRSDIRCRYVIRDSNTVSFSVQDHDPAATLIIDPTVVFCTFTGSKASNWGFTATPGPDGSFFAGGIVFGSAFPYTTGQLQPVYGGDPFDVGIIKFSANGANKLYATYLGGNNSETPHSMVCDPQGNLVVIGRTYSPDFPFITTAGKGGGADIFVAKLNAAGTALIGCLRVGGTADDGVNVEDQLRKHDEHATSLIRNYGDDSRSEVIVDGGNNILVAASSQSSGSAASGDGFPIVGPAFQPNFGGGDQDAVVMKIDPNCSNLIWSSFLGGSGSDAAFVLRENPLTSDIYVAGATASTDLPGDKTGVIQPGFGGGSCDGFVAEISADGSTLKRSTYLGTSSNDAIYGIQFDKQGFPYVMGTTNGTWPVINAAYSVTGARQFVSKLKPDLSGYVYSTTFGTPSGSPTGLPNISPVAFLVDRCQNIYVSGWGGWIIGGESDPYGLAGTSGMPVTKDAIKPVSDNRDFYFIVIQKNASALLYGTFYGQNDNNKSISEHVDGGTSRYDQNGVIYQGICANCNGGASSPFPTTVGVWATQNGAANGCNEAALKIAFNFAGVAGGLQVSANGRHWDTSGCTPLTADLQDTIRNAKRYIWNFGDGGADTATTGYEVQHTYATPGPYTIMMVAIDSNSCNVADTVYRHVLARTDKAPVDFAYVKDPNLPCTSLSYDFTNLSTAPPGKPFGASSFIWDFGDGTPHVQTGTGPQQHSYQATGTYIVNLIMDDTSYCNYPDTATKTLRVSPVAKAQFVTPATGCAPDSAVFNNTSLGGLSFTWDFGDSTGTDTDANPIHVYTNPGTYTVHLLEIDSTTCNQRDSTQMTIVISGKPAAGFTYTPETPVANTPFVFINGSVGAVSYKWLFGDGDSAFRTTMDTVEHLYNQTDTFNVCLVAFNSAGCPDTACHPLAALINPLLDVPNAFTPGRFGGNSVIRVMGFGITHMEWRIYNRWGKVVFQSTDPNIGWDGYFQGQLQPMDVYAYTLEADFSNGRHVTKKGDITLIR